MMSAYSGVASNCLWTYLTGSPFCDTAWGQHLGSCFGGHHRFTEGATLLTIGWQAASPPPAARQELARRIETLGDKLSMFSGSAMVFDSMLARGSLTAVNWIVKKPYPEKVFSNLDEALAWLSSLTPTFDASVVWQAISSTVPKELLLVEYSGKRPG